MRFISSTKKKNTTVQRLAFINQINRITPDFDKKSYPESMKLIKNSKNHNVNELIVEFISSCMKIHDSVLVMQLLFFGSLLVLFVLNFDCDRYAFAILYNDAGMQNYYYTTPTTGTTDTTGTTPTYRYYKYYSYYRYYWY